jgi:outer membrane protein assembly factor BamB
LAADWPQFLGPTRDAVYSGPPLTEQWPREGPPVVWRSVVGEGYSSPVVSEGRLILAHRFGDELLVNCYAMLTGKTNWSVRFPMKFRDGEGRDSGPRPTPTIRGDKVYVCNTDGFLACLDLKNGATIWSKKTKSEFKSEATWHGFVSSPLVTEQAVIVQVGGTNSAGVVAFDVATGDVLWRALNEKASASSPLLATVGGKPQLLVITRTAVHSLNPDTGMDHWNFPTRKQSSGNLYAASPVVFGNHLFIGGGYGLGAQLLQLGNESPKKLWHLDDALSTLYASAIHDGGFLYGFHGHPGLAEGRRFRCVEVASGKVVWEQVQSGSGTVARSGENLLMLMDTGEVVLAKATPKSLQIKSRAQVVGRPTRSYPALVDGYAFIKGPKELVCLDLRARK